MKSERWLSPVCFFAFIMDGGTGLSLLAVPDLTLELMGLQCGELVTPYLRFIGAFVLAVGTLYGLGWRYLKGSRFLEWRVIWIATAWARFCVGTTVFALIVSGSLEVAWISVPVADLGLAGFQAWHLKGMGRNDV